MAAAAPITVAISTMDRPGALARCLESLAAGTAVPAEVVIVDQSPVRSAEPVAYGAEGLPSVRYRHDDGVGLGRSQNLAVRAGSHDAVAVLDDDCVADPAWVATAHRIVNEEEVDLVCGRVLALPDERPGAIPVSLRTSDVRREFRGRSVPWDVGSGNNFAFRREWFERVGGNDERLGPGSPARGGVDIDLFYRMLRAGARGRYEPDMLVLHEQNLPDEFSDRGGDYGFGTGAAFALWLRESGDRYALRLGGAWVRLRGGILLRALGRGEASVARRELTVLRETGRGLAHGWRVAEARRAGR